MTVLYSNQGDLASRVMQPQLTRWRFSMNSPISSLRYNQEDQQFRYDLLRLRAQLAAIATKLQEQISNLEGTSTSLLTGIQATDIDSATPGLQTLSILYRTIDQLGSKLDNFDKRLDLLERGL